MKAIVIDENEPAKIVEMRDDQLMPGDVTIRVTHSTINFKDALALTGRGPVVRRFPMIPGIDLAGTVEHSDTADRNAGDKVLVTGWGMGEAHFGGFAELARVPASWLVRLPAGLAASDAMAIGTARFTAML